MTQPPLRRTASQPLRHAAWLCALALTAGCGQGDDPPRHVALAPVKSDSSAESDSRPEGSQAPTLDEALELAKRSLASLDKIEDYTCTFVKRERVGGDLLDEERLAMKVRHQPFSVYMRFVQPESLAGQEAIYVKGRNDGKLFAHTTGLKGQIAGTMSLDPTGFLAMRNNRYPITNAGMKNLVTLLIQLGQRKDLLQDCRVEFDDDGKIGDRHCQLIEISNPRPVDDFRLAKAKIWLDRERNVPLGFESWEWPKRGKEAVLAERYQYLEVKLDQGLTDRDFDPANPDYAFP